MKPADSRWVMILVCALCTSLGFNVGFYLELRAARKAGTALVHQLADIQKIATNFPSQSTLNEPK